MSKRTLIALVTAALACLAHGYSAEAVNNATIQVTGPRGGMNGKNFFNIEGAGILEQFRSWGAADFNAADFGVPFTVGDVTNFKIVLTEANAAFTSPGKIQFWLTTDTTTSIEPVVSPWVWQNNVTPEGIGTQAPTEFLGSGDFNTLGNMNSGQVNTYAITLSAAAKAIVINALNSNGSLRLVVTPDSVGGPDTVAATFAGFSNNTYNGPVIEFDASAGGPDIVVPSAFLTVRGQLDSGNVASLGADDGDYLRHCKFLVPNLFVPPVEVVVTGTTTKTTTTGIAARLTGRMANAGSFSHSVEQRNQVTTSYEDIATATVNTTESTVTSNSTGSHSQKIGAGGALQARYTIRKTGPSAVATWCYNADLFRWTVN